MNLPSTVHRDLHCIYSCVPDTAFIPSESRRSVTGMKRNINPSTKTADERRSVQAMSAGILICDVIQDQNQMDESGRQVRWQDTG